jgi:hypothetical protein
VVTTRSKALLVGLAGVAFLLLSWSSHHHWDEFLYLYSSASHTPAELMRLDAVMNLFPQGYLSGKIGHIAILHALVGATGRGQAALLELQRFYAALVLAAVAGASALYRELLDERLARRSALVLLFLPLTLYLAYKLLSEVPAFLFTTLACWAFVRAFRAASGRSKALLLSVSTAALAAAMLCRVTAPLGFVGLVLGLLASGDPRFPRPALLRLAVLVGVGALAVHAAVLGAFGESELRLLRLAETVAGTSKGFERAYAVVSFMQGFLLVLPFALGRPWTPAVRMAFVWLLVTVLPNLSGHEPRYYSPALLPLAIVAAIGIDRLIRRICIPQQSWAWGGALAGIVLVNRATLMPLMPYEVDQSDLVQVGNALGRGETRGTILVPWVTDYCFLRFAFPQLPVRLAMSSLPGGRYPGHGRVGPIAPSDLAWVGRSRYVGELPTLERSPLPWYYVGWSYNPVMLRIRSLAKHAGLDVLGDPHRTGWHDHLAESWMWEDPRLAMRPVGGVGQYEVFLVGQRAQSTARTSITSPSPTTNARSSGSGSTIPSPVKLPKAGSSASRSLRRKQGSRSR